MEGAKEIAKTATESFETIGLKNIELIEGNFDDTLPAVVSRLPTVDFVFIDGNHRQEPTERYFLQLLSKNNNDSIFIFDDIHWSIEMEAAWETIKKHPAVSCSIDLFFIGIVFFRNEFKEKQHFRIRNPVLFL
jgi:predicted O-methyltransferase YrrM